MKELLKVCEERLVSQFLRVSPEISRELDRVSLMEFTIPMGSQICPYGGGLNTHTKMAPTCTYEVNSTQG